MEGHDNLDRNFVDASVRQKALEWERRFLNSCKCDPGARKAWGRLEKAGIWAACKRLLWEYATDETSFAEVQRGTALVVHKIEVFNRAHRANEIHSNDPRAQLFRARLEAAASALAKTPWPFRNPSIRTFADANQSYASINLFDLRKVRAIAGRTKLAYMITILRDGARAYGVGLSGNELAALSYCATAPEGSALEGSAVRRLLREPWVGAGEPHFIAVFEIYVSSVH